MFVFGVKVMEGSLSVVCYSRIFVCFWQAEIPGGQGIGILSL
jgi:hypothetical protein